MSMDKQTWRFLSRLIHSWMTRRSVSPLYFKLESCTLLSSLVKVKFSGEFCSILNQYQPQLVFFYKQPVYKQLTLWWQITKQPSFTKQQYKLQIKKLMFFLCNKRKIAVKATIYQHSAISKALLVNS